MPQEFLQLEHLKQKMSDVWSSYLPFVKHYRQDLLTYLDTVPYMDFDKVSVSFSVCLLRKGYTRYV